MGCSVQGRGHIAWLPAQLMIIVVIMTVKVLISDAVTETVSAADIQMSCSLAVQ